MNDEKDPPAPRIETTAPSPEVELGLGHPAQVDGPALPGEHRGGFQRLPTAPVDVPATDVGPSEDVEPLPEYEWVGTEQVHGTLSAWALGLAVVALAASFFVGWTFPLGIAGVIVSIVALRRPWDSRFMAVWALGLSILSILYSAGWLVWLAYQEQLFT